MTTPPPTRSKMEGLYKPPEAPPMRAGADAHLLHPSRIGDDLKPYSPPTYMTAAVVEPANSYRAINLATKKTATPLDAISFKRNPETQKERIMSTKKPAPATPASTIAYTPPPGVVAVSKGTIEKRRNPGAYDDWLALRQVGDLLEVEPAKFESIKGHLQRYAEKHKLNWRIVGQSAGAGGLCKVAIEAKGSK